MSSGKLVYVKFKDHVIFKDHLNAMRVKPIVRETIGWLVSNNDNWITLLWLREPERGSRQLRRETGICILKSDIITMKEVEIDGEAQEM